MERHYNYNRGGGRTGGGRSGGGGRWGGDQGQQNHPHQQGRGGGRGGGDQGQRNYPPQQGRGDGGGGRGQQWGLRPHTGQSPQQYGGRGMGGPPHQQGPRPSGNPYRSDPGRGTGVPGRRPRQLQPQPPSQSMPNIELLKITESKMAPSHPKAAETTPLFPVKRPDGGGTLSIRAPRLLVNHFPVKFNSCSTIIHYDIDIKLESPPKGRPSKILKSELRLIKDKLFLDDPSGFPLSRTAYDGEKNIYSAAELPVGTFKVDFAMAEDMRTSSYVVTVKEVNRLKLSKLKDYLEGKVLLIPRDVLQGMDLVMKENPSRCRISVGRCFYPKENKSEDDLKWGITASKGYQSSLKSTSQGLAMCLDYTVLAFHKRLPVIDYLLEHYNGSKDLSLLPTLDRGFIMRSLKGLKLNVTHRVTKQKYTVARLTDKITRDAFFDVEEPEGIKQVKVVDYYREKYKKEIRHLDIPCLDFGKNNRKNYVPMEFCVLVEGQRFPKEQLRREEEKALKNMSLARPTVRRSTICEMVKASDGPSGGNVSQNFGLQVVKEMTKVQARVIFPPQLKIGGNGVVNVDREKCQWNLVNKSVMEGKSLERWGIVDFTSNEHPGTRLVQDTFINNLMNRCQKLGIHMTPPRMVLPKDMNLFFRKGELEKVLESFNGFQIIVCVMTKIDNGYKILKWLTETRIGVVTQVCLSETANKGKDQFFANLAIKINAKLGGSNMELNQELPFPTFPGDGHAMFIGADVNHPGAQKSGAAREDAPPSIAAVVGTVNWPAANRYAARISPQDSRKEKIVNFGAMCKELIEAYARINKVKPRRIVVFRDGVSEGQFDMVLNEELYDLKKAIYDECYRPTITVLVAQKRHQTRLFLEDGGETENVPPGTVVDTVITHPFEFDFYLCSHYGGLGTSKPTHYYVLYDDHNFGSDHLQKLIYDLCFTFARCTKPVSLAPPVYYADLVAYRGRMYQEAIAMIPPKFVSSRKVTSSSLSPSTDDKFYKLHESLENEMFFV